MMFLCSLTVFMIMLESCVSQSIAPLDNKVLVHALEDETVILSCEYKSSTTPNSLQWYRQYTGSRPEYLLLKYPGSADVTLADPTFSRLNVTDNNNKWTFSISSAAVSDSALYYCAMEPTVTGNPATLYKNSLQDALHVGNLPEEGSFSLDLLE